MGKGNVRITKPGKFGHKKLCGKGAYNIGRTIHVGDSTHRLLTEVVNHAELLHRRDSPRSVSRLRPTAQQHASAARPAVWSLDRFRLRRGEAGARRSGGV